jgi:hypothetical protein
MFFVFRSSPVDNPIADAQAHLLRLFQRHFVALRVSVSKKAAAEMNDTYSAFVLSVCDDWYLVTAGHCLDKITKAIAQGFEVKADLFDGLGTNAKFKTSIPFDYRGAEPTSLDEFGADYGVLRLSYLYRKQLEANGVVPIDENGWLLRPSNYAPLAYLLLGIPDELTQQSGAVMRYWCSVNPIEELPDRPDYIDEPSVPTFYGRILLQDDVNSIVGMSGGPIFSMQYSDDGKLKYWLHALQSGWWSTEHVVGAPLIGPLGMALTIDYEKSGGSPDAQGS